MVSELGDAGLVLQAAKECGEEGSTRLKLLSRMRLSSTMNNLLTRFRQLYGRFFDYVSYLQSPFLLFVRLYWGVQLIQSGCGKLHNLEKVTEFFGSLNLPMPAQTALAISFPEFFSCIFLSIGLLRSEERRVG